VASVLVVQHSPGEGPALLGQWLQEAGLTLDVLSAYNGDALPPAADGLSALLVLGGPMSAYDDEAGRPSAPWIPATKALLRDAVRAGVPTLGVCLGGQLLAEACGGRVRRGTAGPEIGPGLVSKRDDAHDDPLFGPVPITPDVAQWHWDEIVDLPPGAHLLASSPRYANQAFRVGERAWGLQFHIETAPDMLARWAQEDPEALQARGLSSERLAARVEAVQEDFEQIWRPFASRFAGLVSPAR